jgi:tetratricopeptide (TPR) repeat protein
MRSAGYFGKAHCVRGAEFGDNSGSPSESAKRRARPVRLLLAAIALIGLATAGGWSIRLGWADYWIRQETVRGTERAIALIPDNAEYYARFAWLESENDSQEGGEALRRAVTLNPWDAQSWIELGLLAEARGNDTIAKQCLLRAAQVDSKFLPRWTLTNYYFRRNDAAMFWFWARQAASMVYGDAQPLFRLCGKVEDNGTLIDRLEIGNPDVRAAYLSYLLGQNRIDWIGPAVHRLLQENREADVPLLLAACDRLLEARRTGEAAEIWNRLADAGRVRFRTPAGEGEQLIANGNFSETPGSRGFDWRLPVVDGVSVSQEEAPRALRVTFSGKQPEDCEVLAQLVPLDGTTQYQLTFKYRSVGIPHGVGVGWRITNASDGTVLTTGPSLASEANAEGHLPFAAPADCRLVRLALRYHRTQGTTRFEGFLVLWDLALKRGAQSPIEGARVK